MRFFGVLLTLFTILVVATAIYPDGNFAARILSLFYHMFAVVYFMFRCCGVDHWTRSKKLTVSNFEQTVQEVIDSGKTFFGTDICVLGLCAGTCICHDWVPSVAVRWIASEG